MKFSPSIKQRASKGFGLLEVILVFAIVIGAAAVVFTVFQSAKPSADASNEASNLTTIATNLKSTYGINHSYAGLDITGALAAKAIPASMEVGSPPTSAVSQWGAVDVNEGADSTTFDINYATVPSDACAKFVSGVAGFFSDVKIADVSVFTDGKPVSADIITNCAVTDPVVSIDFIGK